MVLFISSKLSTFLRDVEPKTDDDAVDRLNRYYTIVLVGLFAVFLGARQYVGNPIQCWVPAQFQGGWEQYAENYCFVENTYFVPFNESLPDTQEQRKRQEIAYYQWVPFVLAIQGFMLYLPRAVWTMLYSQSGMDVKEITRLATDTNNVSEDSRLKNVAVIASHIFNSATFQKQVGKRSNPLLWILKIGKPKGCFLVLLYMAVKILFIANLIGQLLIIEDFIGTKESFLGFRLWSNLRKDYDWKHSGHFPRTTICDFQVKWLGNVVNYSVQCVLIINMFNEKIYLFLWFWFLAVTIITISNYFYWMFRLFSPGSRIAFVQRHANIRTRMDQNELTTQQRKDPIQLERFVRSKLRLDGVFILMLISINGGSAITAEVIQVLYDKYTLENRHNARRIMQRAGEDL